MELVFASEWPKGDSNAWTRKWTIDAACSWSCRNTIAFSGASGCKLSNANDGESQGGKVHIVDPDRPWQVHSFNTGHANVIRCIRWDISGTRLVTADGSGKCKLWTMRNHILNDWQCGGESTVEGETIVALSWLHIGLKVSYNVERTDSPNVMEKFSRQKFHPSVLQYGGKAIEGWIAITMSGLVSVTLIKANGDLVTATECLSESRTHIALADIAFKSSGHIVIGTSDGSVRCPISFYKLIVKYNKDYCSIHSEALPSLFMQCCTDPNQKDKYNYVSHIQFMKKEAGDQIIACAGGPLGACIECWGLRREPVSVHKSFQASSPPRTRDQQPSTLKWIYNASYTDTSNVAALALPKLPLNLSNKSIYNGPGMVFAVAFHDGSIKLLHRVSLKPFAVFKYEGVKQESGPQLKRQKNSNNGKQLSCIEMSATCCSLIGVDKSGTLCLMKIAPTLGQALDPGAARAHTIAQVVNLLEYCMVTCYDWWDLLLTITPGMVETVIDRLSEAFNRQPKSLQELLFTRLTAVKATLYRLNISGTGKSADCHAKLLLHAIAVTFKSLLRPTSLSSQEKGLAEKLAAVCARSVETDLDKIMMNLDTKEFVIEPATVQSLQQLIQWVADFALFLLSNVPLQQMYSNRPGLSMLRDWSVLCTLRELLVIIRIWGLIKSTCQPVFTSTSDNVDGLSTLFKLLTQVWLCCKDDSYSEFDDALIDECILLPSQLLVPNLESLPVVEGITGKITGKLPMSFHFESTPLHIPHVTSFNPGATPGSELTTRLMTDKHCHKHDIVRRIHLGVAPHDELKQCTRCSCVSLVKSTAQTPALKAWDQRWVKACVCGGQWRKLDLPQPM
ncbi:mediator of RNA polymerase II transcription subunit 16-like [Ptychodera flava]|uniref:mediator of RNA polymerase II transcription subunit 16-like n=1 Tax=Ptychodera flava TaxID=63121 RepID=UPI00396A98E2